MEGGSPGWRRNLYTLWVTQFIALAGMSLVLPFIPLFLQEELGIPELGRAQLWSGIVFSSSFFAAAFMAPVWGTLGDRYGRKPMVVRAVFGVGLAVTLMAFSQNVYQLLVFRLLQGGLGGFMAAGITLVAASAPRERTGYALAVLQTATTAGGLIGPLVGGVLADALGYRPIFLITGAACFVSGVAVAALVREARGERERQTAHPGLRQGLAEVFRSPQLRGMMVILALINFGLMVVSPILTYYVKSFEQTFFGLGPSFTVGLMFATPGLAALLATPFWGKAADRYGPRPTLVVSLFATSLAFAPQAAVSSVWQLFLVRWGMGLAAAGIMPSVYCSISERTSDERIGGAFGLSFSAGMIGGLIGPLTGGVLAARFGMRSVFLVTAVVLCLAAGVLNRARGEERGEGTSRAQ